MARMMARMTLMEALEHKIERAQEQVSRTKKQYDAAIKVLSDLLDKRDALKRDELIKAIMKSDEPDSVPKWIRRR